jgi:gas vesicle protein
MVRDPEKMNPDDAVKAAKEKIRSSAKQFGEEMNFAVDSAQTKLLETVDGLKDRVSQTVDHAQDRVLKTVDEVQDRVHHTAEDLSQSVREAKSSFDDSAQHFTKQLQKPLEMAQHKPLETLLVAGVAGWVVGMLTQGEARPKNRNRRFDQKRGVSPAPELSSQTFGPEPAKPNQFGQAPAALSALAATGLGKMVWDAVREEYLTPQHIRSFVRSIFSSNSSKSKSNL